jgi:hypothetical protein
MGSIISYVNRANNFYDEPRTCNVCHIDIDPDVNMMHYWCTDCNTIWCNDCIDKDIYGLTKLRYDCCGYCDSKYLDNTKAILFDFLTENLTMTNEQVCETLSSKFNLREKFKREFDINIENEMASFFME